MKHTRNLGFIAILSFALSILGFIIDLGERVPDLIVNILDVLLMTVVFFGILSIIYFVVVFLVLIFNRNRIKTN